MFFWIGFVFVHFQLSTSPLWGESLVETLEIGRSLTWVLHGDCDVIASQEGVVDFTDQDSALVIHGLQPGTVHLRCGSEQKTVRVFAPQAFSKQAWQKSLEGLIGLRWNFENGTRQLHGRLLRFKDWKKIAGQTRGFSWQMRADIDPDVRTKALEHLQTLAREQGWGPFTLCWDKPIAVTFSAADQPHSADIRNTFGGFGIAVDFSSQDLSLQPLIRVQIYMVEMEKRWQQRWGIEWPQVADFQVLPKLQGPQAVIAAIQSMESRGQAKVLASPRLLTRSGSSAEFLAGGEFAVKTRSTFSNQVTWKKHGVVLKIKPVSDRKNKIRLWLETEISMLDPAQAVDGIPGLKTNRLQSEFDLFSGQSLSLSGLVKLQEGESRDGLAGLSQIPVLGALFRSQDFLEQRTELVIFVVPEEIKNDGSQKEL